MYNLLVKVNPPPTNPSPCRTANPLLVQIVNKGYP